MKKSTKWLVLAALSAGTLFQLNGCLGGFWDGFANGWPNGNMWLELGLDAANEIIFG